MPLSCAFIGIPLKFSHSVSTLLHKRLRDSQTLLRKTSRFTWNVRFSRSVRSLTLIPERAVRVPQRVQKREPRGSSPGLFLLRGARSLRLESPYLQFEEY